MSNPQLIPQPDLSASDRLRPNITRSFQIFPTELTWLIATFYLHHQLGPVTFHWRGSLWPETETGGLFVRKIRKYLCSQAAQLGNKVWWRRPELGLAMLAAAAASLSSRLTASQKPQAWPGLPLPAPTTIITNIVTLWQELYITLWHCA